MAAKHFAFALCVCVRACVMCVCVRACVRACVGGGGGGGVGVWGCGCGCVCVCVCVSVCVCVCVCVYVCVCVCVCVWGGGVQVHWWLSGIPNRKVGGSKPASGNLVFSFSLSSSGCRYHLAPPHQLTQL